MIKRASILLFLTFSIYLHANGIGRISNNQQKDKLKSLTTKAFETYSANPEKSIEYAKAAITLAESTDNLYQNQKALNTLGLAYYTLKNYKYSVKYFHQSLQIAIELQNDTLTANANLQLGKVSFKLRAYNESLEYFKKAEKIWTDLNLFAQLSETKMNIGDLFFSLENYEAASIYYSSALELSKTNKVYALISSLYFKIGKLNYELGQYHKALESFEEALESINDEENDEISALIYLNLGKTYISLDNYSVAQKKIEKSLEIYNYNKNLFGASEVYLLLGNLESGKNNFENAEKDYLLSLTNAKKTKSIIGIHKSYLGLINLYLKKKDFISAIAFLDSAAVNSNSSGSPILTKDIYHLYYLYYTKTDEFEKGLEYFEKYASIKDSLATIEEQEDMLKLRLNADYNNKLKEDQLVQKEDAIEKLKKSQHFRTYLTLILLTIISLILLTIVYLNQKKIKKLTNKLFLRDKEIYESETLNDLTIQKSKENSNRLNSILNNDIVAIGIIDFEGKFLFVNQYFSKLLGYDQVELYTLTSNLITHKDDVQPTIDYVEKVKSGEIDSFLLKKRLIKKNGNLIWIELSATVVFDNNGERAELIGIFREIDEPGKS